MTTGIEGLVLRLLTRGPIGVLAAKLAGDRAASCQLSRFQNWQTSRYFGRIIKKEPEEKCTRSVHYCSDFIQVFLEKAKKGPCFKINCIPNLSCLFFCTYSTLLGLQHTGALKLLSCRGTKRMCQRALKANITECYFLQRGWNFG